MGASPLNSREEKNILQITLMMKGLQKGKGRNNYNIHFSVCVAQGGLFWERNHACMNRFFSFQ
jgi:hypothetical protein